MTTKAPWSTAPSLDIDTRLGRGAPSTDARIAQRQRRANNERDIAWNLIAHLERAGFAVHGVHDGDEYVKTPDAKAAMELLFNLDEASLRFHKAGFSVHGVLLIFDNGNDGWDVISDWNYTKSDPDGFSATLDAFLEDYILPRSNGQA